MPGIGDRLAAAEAAPMFADDRAILADHDAIGIGLDLDRPTARQAASSGSAHTWSHVLSEGTNCAHIRQARSKVVRRIITKAGWFQMASYAEQSAIGRWGP
jgi:hypothetical protein